MCRSNVPCVYSRMNRFFSLANLKQVLEKTSNYFPGYFPFPGFPPRVLYCYPTISNHLQQFFVDFYIRLRRSQQLITPRQMIVQEKVLRSRDLHTAVPYGFHDLFPVDYFLLYTGHFFQTEIVRSSGAIRAAQVLGKTINARP